MKSEEWRMKSKEWDGEPIIIINFCSRGRPIIVLMEERFKMGAIIANPPD
jgi:hypothetical protein